MISYFKNTNANANANNVYFLSKIIDYFEEINSNENANENAKQTTMKE